MHSFYLNLALISSSICMILSTNIAGSEDDARLLPYYGIQQEGNNN
jgi:hypothetical protein